jgi:hypothetical protein
MKCQHPSGSAFDLGICTRREAVERELSEYLGPRLLGIFRADHVEGSGELRGLSDLEARLDRGHVSRVPLLRRWYT